MNASESLSRPNRFEIDLGAVANCVRKIRETIGPSIYFFATLKANAYGYGLLPAAKAVVRAGADAISLVSLDDAVSLRGAGIRVPIMVYAGSVPGEEIVRAAENYDLIPTLHCEESLAAFSRHARKEIKVAVKLEVGPERIGVPAEDAVRFVKSVTECSKLRMHVLNAHPNVPATGRYEEALEWQFHRFVAACNGLEQAGIRVPLKVVASSKVLRLAGKSMMLNAVDPGAALFSTLNPKDSPDEYQPFHALRSRLIQVRNVSRTAFLEEAPFSITPGMRIGIIPMGYSDGLHRLHCGEVLVRGTRVPILAAPALEYTRIDLTRVPAAAVGDEVVIIGAQNGQRISPEEVVKNQGASRVPDLALEVRPTILRTYLGE
jgi:alanine racemase